MPDGDELSRLAYNEGDPLYILANFDPVEAKFQEWMDKLDNPIWIALHNSHIGYIIRDENIYHDFLGTKSIARLYKIKQLGLLSGEDIFIANQTRLDHSLYTPIYMETVLDSHNFPEEMIHLGIASAISHDVATPALSDQGKLANRNVLDEERNIDIILARVEMLEILEKYGINPEDVAACVRGDYPIIGELLNSNGVDLDKIAYTARDTEVFKTSGLSFGEPLAQLDGFLADDLFDIHEDIVISDNDIYFMHPERVYNFLMVRGLMFRDVYRNPIHMGREAFIKKYIEKLWEDGILTRDNMIIMSDIELLDILKRRLPSDVYAAITSLVPGDYIKEEDRISPGDNIPKGDEYATITSKPFNPATSTMVYTTKGIQEFRDAYPSEAGEIESMAKTTGYTGVYKLRKHPGS